MSMLDKAFNFKNATQKISESSAPKPADVAAGTTASPAATPGDTIGVFNPQNNVLDSVDNVSYHFKLFMLPQIESSSDSFDVTSTNAIILAESGKTGNLSIETVNIRNVVGTNKTQKSMTSLEVNMEIREYAGASFLDNIYAASTELGIDSYYKCPYFLELTFTGRSPKSSLSINSDSSNTRWVYPLVILSVETKVDSGGSYYSIKTVAWTNQGCDREVTNVPQQVSIDANTVGDAVSQLSTQINKILSERKIDKQTIPDEISIDLNSTFKNMRLIAPEDVKTASSRTESTSKKSGNRVISIPANTDLRDILGIILGCAPEYQRKAKGSNEKLSAEISEEYKRGEPRVLHRIHMTTLQGKYDAGVGRYAKTYVYSVLPYETHTTMLDPTETNADSTARLNRMISTKCLNKEYNYIFTGKNDQVIDFNMKFNFAWYANVPVQGAAMTQQSSKNDGKVDTNRDEEYIKLKNKITEYIKKLANTPLNKMPNPGELDEYRKSIDESKLSQLEKNKLNNELSKVTNDRISSSIKDASDKKDSIDSAHDSKGDNSPKTGINKFAYDIVNSKAAKSISASLSGRRVPMSYQPAPIYENFADSMNQNMLVEGSGGTGRGYVNSLYKMAFGAKSGDLIQITLTIKGDPYWLEKPISGTTFKYTVSSDPQDYAPTDDYASTVAFENYFIMRLKTPDVPQIKTGLIIARPTLIDGVYGVLEVNSTFTNGLFTQVLDAVIDPITRLESLSELTGKKNLELAKVTDDKKSSSNLGGLGKLVKAAGTVTALEGKAHGILDTVHDLENKVHGVVDNAVSTLEAGANKVTSGASNFFKNILSRGAK